MYGKMVKLNFHQIGWESSKKLIIYQGVPRNISFYHQVCDVFYYYPTYHHCDQTSDHHALCCNVEDIYEVYSIY